MIKINLDGKEEEVSENVYAELNLAFNTLEGLRIRLCEILGIDYLSTNDDDILAAAKSAAKFKEMAMGFLYNGAK